VTDLINDPPQPDEEPNTNKPSSPWVTLVSMVLLIAALLLTSAMLFDYAMSAKGGGSDKPGFGMAGLLDKSKEIAGKIRIPKKTDAEQTSASTNTPSAKGSGIAKLFSGNKDKPIKWPKLKLTGFGRSIQGDGDFAIINGKKILAGQDVGDVKLIEIRSQDVLLEYKGEHKTLTVDIKQ
jgi:hypothetical protein